MRAYEEDGEYSSSAMVLDDDTVVAGSRATTEICRMPQICHFCFILFHTSSCYVFILEMARYLARSLSAAIWERRVFPRFLAHSKGEGHQLVGDVDQRGQGVETAEYHVGFHCALTDRESL